MTGGGLELGAGVEVDVSVVAAGGGGADDWGGGMDVDAGGGGGADPGLLGGGGGAPAVSVHALTTWTRGSPFDPVTGVNVKVHVSVTSPPALQFTSEGSQNMVMPRTSE